MTDHVDEIKKPDLKEILQNKSSLKINNPGLARCLFHKDTNTSLAIKETKSLSVASNYNYHNANPSEIKRYLIKKAYQTITDRDRPIDPSSIQSRIDLIRHLGGTLRTNIINSRAFRLKIEAALENYRPSVTPVGVRLRKARKRNHLSQKQLAALLGFKSHVPITQYENGHRYPPTRVFQWLKDQGM